MKFFLDPVMLVFLAVSAFVAWLGIRNSVNWRHKAIRFKIKRRGR